MAAKRSDAHTQNIGKWEFGCAKASGGEKLINTITEYYRKVFAIDIDLVLDNNRTEKQPFPIAVYEITEGDCIKKGIIFLAKVKHKYELNKSEKYQEIKWLNREQLYKIAQADAVQDFHKTIDFVFSDRGMELLEV